MPYLILAFILIYDFIFNTNTFKHTILFYAININGFKNRNQKRNKNFSVACNLAAFQFISKMTN